MKTCLNQSMDFSFYLYKYYRVLEGKTCTKTGIYLGLTTSPGSLTQHMLIERLYLTALSIMGDGEGQKNNS